MSQTSSKIVFDDHVDRWLRRITTGSLIVVEMEKGSLEFYFLDELMTEVDRSATFTLLSTLTGKEVPIVNHLRVPIGCYLVRDVHSSTIITVLLRDNGKVELVHSTWVFLNNLK